jgi:Flp pilus assembly protein TadD
MNNILTKNGSFWICLALAFVVAAVYFQVYNFNFVNIDDPEYVSENPNIQTGFTLQSIKWAFTSGHASNWHPLTWLSHMLDWQFYGSNPAGHHLTNLFFHIANTLLLFLVLKRMTNAIWQSAFAAALFALHPLHVESVAWVAERKDVLSTFFWILTMAAYLRYVRKMNTAPFLSRLCNSYYLLTVAFFALGLMAKPMVVTLPFVLLLLDYWPLERKVSRRLLVEKIPFIILSAVSSVITFIVQQSGGAISPLTGISIKMRICNALISYVQYIGKMVWPRHLAFFYPYPVENVSILFTVASAALLTAATILVLRFAKKHQYLFTGWFWYLGTLVPVIGIVQVGDQAMADRYTYITLTGLFIIIAWGLPEFIKKWPHRKIVLWSSSLIVLSALTICTFFQLQYWKDDISLCQHALAVTKDNYHAHFCMSKMLMEQGRNEEAVLHCSEAIRIKPNDLSAQIGLTSALLAVGRLDQAQIECQKFLQNEPNDPNLLNNLGVAFGREGKFDQAAKYLAKALENNPDFAKANENIGNALFHQGKINDAVLHLTKAIRLDPKSASAHYRLGQILVQTGKINDAVSHLEEAIRLKPDWTEPMNVLAWLLAASNNSSIRNPDKAVQLAQRVCELTNYKDPFNLDTLAAAFAAGGNFSRAIETAQKAAGLCQSPRQDAMKKEIENRLALYKAGKPYVEPLLP